MSFEITPELLRDKARVAGLLGAVESLAESDPAQVTQVCTSALTHYPTLAAAYRILAKALRTSGNAQALGHAAGMSRHAGLSLVDSGDIVGAAAFFREVAETLPDP